MKVKCLCCGHNVTLDEAYDDYEGQIKCFACRAILRVRTEEGSLKSVEFVEVPAPPSLEEAFERAR